MKSRLLGFVFVLITTSTSAALIDRGNNLIYDTVLDVTWYSNIASASIWGLGNDNDGLMTWDVAMSWVQNLQYAGYSSWRLPHVTTDTGFNISGTNSELGYMHYVNWSNNAGSHSNTTMFSSTFPLDPSTFIWSNTEIDGSLAMMFTWTGFQGSAIKGNQGVVWAVHDGDIGSAVVPIPPALWLFGSGLLGLFGLARRKHN